MIINVTFTSPADDAFLSGFARATGWTLASPLTKKQWYLQRVREWSRRTAISGATMAGVSTEQTAFRAAIKTAQQAAAEAIPLPSGNLG